MPIKTQKRKQDNTELSSILTLLNNINDLITISNKRKEASDVMNALTIYAKNLGYKLPQERIDSFHSVLLDSRPVTLSFLLHTIANDIITSYKIKEIGEVEE